MVIAAHLPSSTGFIMNELVKVLVAVKNNLLSKGLVQLINGESGFLIVGETNSEFSAMRLIRQHQPDVVLIDTSISIEALRILKRQFGACLLMLAISDSGIDFFRALTAGVDAYLLKNAKPEQLYQTMHQLGTRTK